jgi:hypothetical protein
MEVLAYIHLLYDVERAARDGQRGAAGRRALRQARSRRIRPANPCAGVLASASPGANRAILYPLAGRCALRPNEASP